MSPSSSLPRLPSVEDSLRAADRLEVLQFFQDLASCAGSNVKSNTVRTLRRITGSRHRVIADGFNNLTSGEAE